MIIKYKILSANEIEHSMVVRFFTDTISEDYLAIDKFVGIQRGEDGSPLRCVTEYNITIFETPAPTGEKLDELIMRNAPVDYFKMLDNVNDPQIDTSMSEIKTMLGKTFEKEYVPVLSEEQKSTEEISDEQFLKSVEKLLSEMKQTND